MRPLQDLKCNATIDISDVLNEALVISYTGMTYNTTSIFGIEVSNESDSLISLREI